MRLPTLISLTSLTALAGLLPLATTANAYDDTQKKEIGAIVREYLMANPEVIVEVQKKLEEKREIERQQKALVAVSENSQAIFNSKYDISLGNPTGKVTIVEFFDYNCGYCKGALADMDAIIKANPEVRFVLKEFPILGEDSVAAHRVSDAFRKIAPEKYGDFHRMLLGGSEHANEAQALAVASQLGISEEQIRTKMSAENSEESVREAYQLAQSLGITGTPSYILGDEAIFGAIGAEAINQKVANVEACGKTVC